MKQDLNAAVFIFKLNIFTKPNNRNRTTNDDRQGPDWNTKPKRDKLFLSSGISQIIVFIESSQTF